MKEVHKLPVNSDLSECAIESAARLYQSVYGGEYPTAVLYSSGQWWEKMYRYENKFPLLNFILLPDFPADSWCVCGPEGMVWSEGA